MQKLSRDPHALDKIARSLRQETRRTRTVTRREFAKDVLGGKVPDEVLDSLDTIFDTSDKYFPRDDALDRLINISYEQAWFHDGPKRYKRRRRGGYIRNFKYYWYPRSGMPWIYVGRRGFRGRRGRSRYGRRRRYGRRYY